jgi:hypothetical protein
VSDRVARLDVRFSCILDRQIVRISDLQLACDRISDGRLKARFTGAGRFLFDAWSGIAA